MISPIEPGMISSKEVMSRTGISRATLNNYIGLDLIPSPSVGPSEEPGGPTKIGYFPEWVVERIEKIQQLKGQGMRMSQIAMHFMAEKNEIAEAADEPLMHQWLDQILFPAILVSRSWEIVALNNMAENLLVGEKTKNLLSPGKQKFLGLSLIRKLQNRFSNWKEILIFHMRLARTDVGVEVLQPLYGQEDSQLLNELRQMWHEAELPPSRPFGHQALSVKYHHGGAEHYTLLSWALPEGTLFLYPPASMQLDQMIDLLTGKTKIPKHALLGKTSSPTPVCILAVHLESELHLQTALPPSTYFDLICQITLGWHRCFRDHGAIPGRSYQESSVSFFFEESEREHDYLFRSLLCAKALKDLITTIDREWKNRQSWNNTLRVNIGIHCGCDWLGMVPSASSFEVSVGGDTLIKAVALGEFSQGGAIWASKDVIENLSPSNRARVKFGIRLGRSEEGFLSSGLYSLVGRLRGEDELKGKKLQSIEGLAVTEILDVLS